MTPEEVHDHLVAIREVVDRAREERVRHSDMFVVWGIVLVCCTMATLAGDAVGWPWGWVTYPVLGSIAAGWTAWTAWGRGLRHDTYGGRIEGTAWASVVVGLVVLLLGGLTSGVLPLEAITPIVSVLAGVALTVAGAIYRTWVLAGSGWAFIGLALPCFFLPWQAQYALFAVALVFGYVVPGLVLMRRERRAV